MVYVTLILRLRHSVLLGPLSPRHSTVPNLNDLLVRLLPCLLNHHSIGIVVILFCQCMIALFAHAGKRLNWILVAHTVAMFSLVTIYTATSLNIQSFYYVDERENFNIRDILTYGPLYVYLAYTVKSIDLVPTVAFILNGWLADGLLVSHTPNSFAGHLT